MEKVKRSCLFGELSDSRTWAWSRLSELRDGTFSAELLSPQRRLIALLRLLRKEMMTLIVMITFVTFAFVPWKAVCSTKLSTL